MDKDNLSFSRNAVGMASGAHHHADRPLIALDLLRFACAMGVVLYHLFAASLHQPSPHGAMVLVGLLPPGRLAGWTWWGWIGVEIFFVISGYVIARSAEGMSARVFLRRRALRLWPSALICATATLAVLLAAGIDAPGRLANQWLVSATLWPVGQPIDGSYWTLPIEMTFYLVVAAALAVAPARRIEPIGVAIGVVSIVASQVMPPAWGNSGALPHLCVVFALYGSNFALGIALAAGHRHGFRPASLAWTASMAAMTFLTVGAGATVQAARLGVPAGPWAPLAATAIGVAMLACAPALQPRLARLRVTRHCATLGLMTYPLYLVHQDAGLAIVAALARAGVPYETGAAIVVVMALAFARWVVAVEPALRRWLSAAPFSPFRVPAPDNLATASLPTG